MSTHSSSLAWRIPWMEELFLESRNEVMELCRVTINTDTGLTNIHLILLLPSSSFVTELQLCSGISYPSHWHVLQDDLISSFMDYCYYLVTKLCLTFWSPVDCSLPGPSVHGISQIRILELVAISFSRGSSWPRDQTCISCISRWILYHWATWEVQLYYLQNKSISLSLRVVDLSMGIWPNFG